MEENKIVVPQMEDNIISSLTNDAPVMYMSFPVNSAADRASLYNITSGQSNTIKSMINKPIKLRDVVVMEVDISDGETGEVLRNPRTILIDMEGNAYAATSWGVYRCVQKLNAIFGTLHFDEGLDIMPVEITTKKGFTINLRII